MFAIVVNPASGNGRHDALVERLKRMLNARSQACAVYETTGVGDTARQVRRAMDEGCHSVALIGGDGTLSEAVGELAGSPVTLYIVPCGTGNDFARVLRLPKDPAQAFAAQLDGVACRIDCGLINGCGFINVSGSGFDVEVLKKTEELKARYPGGRAYRKAVLSVLERYKPFEAELSIDGGPFRRERLTIVEIANGQYIGGGMRVAPRAKEQDGLFDVVLVRTVPRGLIPLLLPLFMLGLHAGLPVTRMCRARSVVLRAPGMTVNIDGRLVQMDEAHYRIMPGALRMMRPAR